MAEDTGQERTEEPTPKKIRETREKGQIPRSRELNSMAMLMAAGGALLIMGSSMLADLRQLMKQGLSIEPAKLAEPHNVVQVLSEMVMEGMIIIAPILFIMVVIVIMTPIGLGGFSFSAKSLAFKWDKLDPIKGLGRIFALKGLMELTKVLAKFALVSGIAGMIVWSSLDELMTLGQQPLQTALTHLAQLCGWTFFACSCAMILIAAVDAPFQLWQHNKQLKMTLQEVKDENKETDGRPEVKSRIRRMQQELSQARMMEAVPDADVIITNPTHYAIALQYDQEKMPAPKVIAKGADVIAARIREVADEHSIAIVEAPPLARALYASTEINDEIPAGLYLAVANILSYVYQLYSSQEAGFDAPEKPTDLPIPDELIEKMKARNMAINPDQDEQTNESNDDTTLDVTLDISSESRRLDNDK